MGEDHEFVTDWLVSQGQDNINLIYLKLVIQHYKSLYHIATDFFTTPIFINMHPT